MARQIALLLSLALALNSRTSFALAGRSADGTESNPIRKVVTMLQAMQKKVAEEGEKEEALYKRFMCYCKTNGGELKESIASAETKGPQVESDIKAAEAQKEQLEEDLKQHKTDRASAQSAIKEATSIREKDAAAYAKVKAEHEANIEAVEKAVTALENGMAGGFLQTKSAQVLRHFVSTSEVPEDDRQEVLAFLTGGASSDYSPKSGEVTGILKQLGADMKSSLAAETATEKSAIESYEELMAAKKKELKALQASIESKTQRSGEVAVSIVQMKNDLSDSEAALIEDKKFLDELEKGCETKTADWEARVKTRQQELLALAETIKVLNDDDALDLFKRTLQSPAASSLVQIGAVGQAARGKALEFLRSLSSAARHEHPQLDLISLALSGKKIGFEKVIAMIDEMVETLKKEQVDDEHKKTYCSEQLDSADDKKKVVERAISDSEAAMASAQEGIATLKEEIETLLTAIKALDKSVAEAGEMRKSQHEEFSELMSSNSAAKQLLEYAKNRLNRFYNPKLYLPPPKQELSRQDQIAVNMGGDAPTTPPPGGIAGTGIAVLAQVSSHARQLTQRDAPPPPPETYGAYATKSQESTGVIAMIDLLIKDLVKDMTQAETEEKDSQAEYEALMGDSAAKRAQDSKSLTEKEAARADMSEALESHKSAKEASTKELMQTSEYIASLHAECDWLLKYFDARKEARSAEMDSLENAKAVLSGADFSLLQARRRNFLGRVA